MLVEYIIKSYDYSIKIVFTLLGRDNMNFREFEELIYSGTEGIALTEDVISLLLKCINII